MIIYLTLGDANPEIIEHKGDDNEEHSENGRQTGSCSNSPSVLDLEVGMPRKSLMCLVERFVFSKVLLTWKREPHHYLLEIY